MIDIPDNPNKLMEFFDALMFTVALWNAGFLWGYVTVDLFFRRFHRHEVGN